MNISNWISLLAVGISAVALYLAWRSDRRAEAVEKQVAQFREEANRPKLAFWGVRFDQALTVKPEAAKQGADPAHVNARTCVHNFGANEATVTKARHRVHVGGSAITPRNKNPEPAIIAPDSTVAFKWDLDMGSWRRALAKEISVDVYVEIDYMGVGARSYRYEGHYQYSPDDDQFVCLGESNLP